MSIEDLNESEMDLADMANTILAVMNYSSQISEEDLFSDEFYILVFSALTSDEEEMKLEPGKTPEEKIENLKLILGALSQLFKEEILEIDVKKIIMKKDKENARKLVEALYIMIQMLVQENMKLEEEKGDGDLDEEIKSHSFNDNRMNLSEKKQTEKMRRNKDEEINIENLESLRLGKDKDKNKDKKKEEKKEENEQSEEKLENILSNTDNNKKSLNIDDEDEEIKLEDLNDVNNKMKDSSNKKNKDEEMEISIEKDNILNKEPEEQEKETEENKIDDNIGVSEKSSEKKDIKINITDSEKQSAKKISNEIPNLLDEEEGNNEVINIIQKAKNQLEDMRLSEQESSDSRLNNTEKRKAHSVSQSLPKLYNQNLEDDNDMDLENYNENEDNDFDYDYNPNKKNKKTDSGSNSNINIDNSSKKKSNKSKSKELDDDNIDINDNDNDNIDIENSKSIPQSSEKKENSKKNTSSKKKAKDSTNKKSPNKKENQIESQKSKSKKKEISEKKENQEQAQESGQKEAIALEGEQEQKNSQGQEEENDIENEEPLIEEENRYEIMKQHRITYGDKLDNLFLKYNLENSRNTFELALRNIKLAKQRMLKIENRLPEVDDLKTKEYILRYEKERQLMEANYNKDQKRINFFEERAINNFKQNMRDVKKAKEIEARKTEIEIERRRKAQEVRDNHNKIRFCNEIYKRALELEKEKKIEKMRKKREENKKENEEKRLAMERIENYYKDQIRILREILQNEKKQKEIEHRAHIKFLSTFAKEKREEYRKELENIFDRFEQEEKKNEFERKNKKELAKIFDSYYGK